MKTIGLIGGMSWESTAVYYKLMNERVRARLGGLNSAQLVLWSFNFEEIAQLQSSGQWEKAAEHMVFAANALQAAGADGLVICTNTMHKLAPEIEHAVNLPLLHIADATADAIQAAGINKVGLLATRFTMEEDFYRARLKDMFGIEAIIPTETQRAIVHDTIYNELCSGLIMPQSRLRFLEIIDALVQRGAGGIILGCTEIGLLIKQSDTQTKLFDSTELHANAAVDWSLEN